MAKGGLVEDLMGLSFRLPWRVGVASAVIAGVAFHILAVNPTAPPPNVATVDQLGHFAQDRLIGVVAWFMQFMVPACLCFGALASYLKGRAVRSNPAKPRRRRT